MNVKYGWYCYCREEDYYEAEGIVWFRNKPKIGEKFPLPSSKFKEEWEVESVNENDLSIKAKKSNGS